jgi:hypothetical protein
MLGAARSFPPLFWYVPAKNSKQKTYPNKLAGIHTMLQNIGPVIPDI